jgi:hypothetical protein
MISYHFTGQRLYYYAGLWIGEGDFNKDSKTIQATINWFIKSGKKHFLMFTPDDLSPNTFIKYVSYQGKITLIFVNTLHPFYKIHIHEHYLNGDKDLESLILFIISWVSAENHYNADPKLKELIGQFRVNFGLKLAENLSQWGEVLGSNG